MDGAPATVYTGEGVGQEIESKEERREDLGGVLGPQWLLYSIDLSNIEEMNWSYFDSTNTSVQSEIVYIKECAVSQLMNSPNGIIAIHYITCYNTSVEKTWIMYDARHEKPLLCDQKWWKGIPHLKQWLKTSWKK